MLSTQFHDGFGSISSSYHLNFLAHKMGRMVTTSKGHYTCCVCMGNQLCLTLVTAWLYPARLLCPWNSPGKSTGVSCHFLLQEIFLTQGLNLSLLLGRWVLSHWTTWETFLCGASPYLTGVVDTEFQSIDGVALPFCMPIAWNLRGVPYIFTKVLEEVALVIGLAKKFIWVFL